MVAPMDDIREQAIRFTMSVLHRATDWQEGQDALANHDRFGPWLAKSADPIGDSQDIIRAAEDRLGASLPY